MHFKQNVIEGGTFLVSRLVGDIRRGPAWGPLAVLERLKCIVMDWNEICTIEMVCNDLKWIEMISAQNVRLSCSFVTNSNGLKWNQPHI